MSFSIQMLDYLQFVLLLMMLVCIPLYQQSFTYFYPTLLFRPALLLAFGWFPSLYYYSALHYYSFVCVIPTCAIIKPTLVCQITVYVRLLFSEQISALLIQTLFGSIRLLIWEFLKQKYFLYGPGRNPAEISRLMIVFCSSFEPFVDEE